MVAYVTYLLLFFVTINYFAQAKVRNLYGGETVNIMHGSSSKMEIFCYNGKPKYIIHIWQSIHLHIDLDNDNFVQYDGSTVEEVQKKHLEHQSSWSINLFSWKQKKLKLNPFNRSCVGIDSKEGYNIHLNVIRIDYWKVLLLACGILLFLSAEKLSKNTLFYYLTGISLGISASFLILIYFISKLFPKKPMMYGAVVCGWTIGVYILQLLWENIRVILTTYQKYVGWYILLTGLLSFFVCYRMGPVTNHRTKNLIKWSLQGAGLICILFSSEFQEAAMAQVIVLVMGYNIPKSWVSKSKSYWRRKFPPKVKLLNNDEYYQQGVLETSKALDELRTYCSSPECNQWKTVLLLQNAKRFASFVEGNSHLSDEEILHYESSLQQTDLTDDEDSEADLTDD